MKARLFLLALFAAAIFCMQPWGNFPLNDDWQYAWVAQRWATTGRLIIDVPVAPALVGQSLLGAAWIKLFGFSFLKLRVLTLLCALATVWVMDALLSTLGLALFWRLFLGALLVINPLFLHVSTTFMTEIYGFLPALAGALVWLRARRKNDQAPLSWKTVVGASLLIGWSFWTRQFCVLTWGALAGAAVIEGLLSQKPRLRQECPRLLFSGAIILAFAFGYGTWARLSGNLNPAFTNPLAQAVRSDAAVLELHFTNFCFYFAAFLFPLPLLMISRRLLAARWEKILSLLLMFYFVGGWVAYKLLVDRDNAFSTPVHRHFPFIGNVLYWGGIGPLTLPDQYTTVLLEDLPHWPYWTSVVAEAGLFFLGLFWLPSLVSRSAQLKQGSYRREFAIFSLLFTALMVGAPLQAYKLNFFDRYYVGALFGMLLFLGTILPSPPRRAWFWFLGLLPLALYSVGGLHDYFSWNDSRWKLVQRAQSEFQAKTDEIDGGYEVNGWLYRQQQSDWTRRLSPGPEDRSYCGPYSGFVCGPRTFSIGSHPPRIGQVIASDAPSSWLVDRPPLLLIRRPDDHFRSPKAK